MANNDQTRIAAQTVACATARQSSRLPTGAELWAAAQLTREERAFLLKTDLETDALPAPPADARADAALRLVQRNGQESHKLPTADKT